MPLTWLIVLALTEAFLLITGRFVAAVVFAIIAVPAVFFVLNRDWTPRA